MPTPQRYVVSATLLTCSPLAIHSGMGSLDQQLLGLAPEGSFREVSGWNAEELESCDQLIVRDWAGRPYVPGSSLKGVLREYVTRDGWNSLRDASDWLLGRECPPASEGPDEDDAQGEGGAAVFEDAFLATLGAGLGKALRHLQPWSSDWRASLLAGLPFSKLARDFAIGAFETKHAFAEGSWRAAHERLAFLTDTHHLPYWSPQQLSYVEHHVAIDRRTGTAGKHRLFTAEAVPAGLPFQVQVIVDHGDRALEATRLLLRALAGFNLDPVQGPIQLGSGTNHGWGRLACLFPTVRVQVWTPQERKDVSPDELNVEEELKQGLKHPPGPRKARVQLRLQLTFDSPFLVNDPAKVCALQATDRQILRSGSDEKKKPPDHVPRVAGTRIVEAVHDAEGNITKPAELRVIPLLPATGFKGPVRSQLERILRTIHPGIGVAPHGELDPVADGGPAFVPPLFGCDAQESGIWCSEFVGTQEQDLTRSKREMVAIDRFTGGASEHAKFDALCLDRPTLDGVLALDLPPSDEESGDRAARQTLGAGILLLRDLLEGDVAFGFGDMKSFGQCRAEIRSLAVAGLEQHPELAGQIEQQAEPGNLNGWIEAVRKAFADGCVDNRVKRADDLLDDFLAAVREDLSPETPLIEA